MTEPVSPTVPSIPGTSGALGRWASAGWPGAIVGALIVASVGLVLAEVAAFGFALAGGSVGSAAVARAGGLLFYAFHHVPLTFGASVRTSSGAARVGVTLAAAPMLGTFVIGAASFLVGRSMARRANAGTAGTGGEPSVAALAFLGAKLALPYALLCAAGTALARLTVTPSGSARVLLQGAFTVGPALVPAFVWALVLAGVTGAVGAVTMWRPTGSAPPSPDLRATHGFDVDPSVTASAQASRSVSSRRSRAVAGAILGGGLMALIGIVLAFAGLLVMAAVDNHATRGYFDTAFRGGSARGSAVVGLTALEVPNMATWVLYPAMGSCIAVAQRAASTGVTPVDRTSSGGSCVLSYRRLPTSAALARAGSLGRAVAPASANVPPVPPGSYLLFLLVPATAVLVGGWVAAARSAHPDDPPRASQGASAGALAGVVFAAWAPLLVLLSTISVTVGGVGAAGLGGRGTVAAGPPLLLSVAVAAAWGIVGGATGGTLRVLVARSSEAPVRERVFPERVPAEGPASQPDPSGSGPGV